MTDPQTRLANILAKPIPRPRMAQDDPNRWRRQSSFYLSDEAHNNLKALAPLNNDYPPRPMPRLVAAYIDAIARANPTYRSWQDTRPQHMKDADRTRLQGNPPLLPLWSDGDGRLTQKRHHTFVLRSTTITLFASLSRIYGIGKQVYVSYDTHLPGVGYMEGMRSTTFATLDRAPDRRLCGYALQAYAMGYLTPMSTQGTDRETLSKITYPNHKRIRGI